MVGLRRIARRWADAAIGLGDALVVSESLIGRIGPELAAHALMHALGESLRDTISQSLDENRSVVVIRLGKALRENFLARARGHDESPDIIRLAARCRGDEIGEREIVPPLALTQLLAQGVERGKFLAARLAR